jgi:hypothetical protein
LEGLYDLLKRIIGVLLLLPPFALAFFAGGIYFKLAVFLALLILYYEIYRIISNRFNPYAFLFGIFTISISFWKGEDDSFPPFPFHIWGDKLHYGF